MSVNLADSKFSADFFILREDNQPVCTDQFLHGLQVLATQAALAINKPKAVEQAFECIQEAKWEHTSSEAKNDVDQKIQDLRQKWVKVCFGEQFLHVPREHLEKNCGPKFQAQYTSKMKEATEPKLNLLPPEGVAVDAYDITIIKAFLDYIQTGTLSENALNAYILDLLSLAQQHQIEGLITKCTEFLKEQLDDHENLDTAWEVAIEQNIPQLIFACLSYMQANQDKISKELKGKCEKALPIVKALFKNEIILNRSPSGNIEVRVDIYNEETASHIKQLSKLFSIRSLVISEIRTEKRLINGEKLFPFLNEISPKLKDLQELIIWNEAPKDRDFQSLKDLFPKLTAYGNDAPFLKNFEEVKTYLNNFRNPDEDDQGSEKLALRSLNLSSLSTLDNVQMAELTPHLQDLYHIFIKSDNITLLAAPKATEIICYNCNALTTLKAPEASEIYCDECTSLTTINAPEASEIYCNGCTSLTTINAPKATNIDCRCCTALTTLKAPKAIKIYCGGCKSLTTLAAPKATKIYFGNCTALTILNAPKATKISSFCCTALTTIEAPKVTKIFSYGCTALKTIEAPKATDINCYLCAALKTINAPEATKIFCSGCTALTTLIAPKATQIDCVCCTSLTTLDAPNATQIDCRGCPKLKPMIAN